MARGRELEANIHLGGELDRSLRTAIDRAVDALNNIDESAVRAAQAASELTDELSDQRAALKAAQRQYAAYVLSGEEGSQAAEELADSIRELSSDLNRNESRMRAAQEAAQRLANDMDDADHSFDQASDSIDDVGNAARDTEGGFTVMKGAIANVIGNGITALIDKCAEAVSSLYGLSEETREFRQDMATLETAYDKAGFSAETAGDTWKGLYAIFGEDDRAVEAANNISRMADNQKELDEWVRISTGIWGDYQDALAVESLAEAAGESAKVGTVVGTLADALNWSSEAAKMFSDVMDEDVTTAEDAFNVVLSQCTSEAERQAVITQTLIDLYGDSADKYNEVAASIIDANKATADYTVAAAEFGERMEPITTSVREGFAKILNKVLELTDGVDFAGFSDTVSAAFDKAASALDGVSSAIGWVKDNANILIPIVAGLTGAFVAYKAVSTAMAIAEAVKTAVLATGATTITATTVATWALNAAMAVLTSPIFLVVAAVGALIAIGVALWQNWDTVKVKASELWAAVVNIFSGIGSAISGAFTAAMNAAGSFFGWIGEKLAWLNEKIESIPVIGSLYSGAKDAIGGLFGGDVKAYAKGGFTDGVSIAGEAGTEAIISFDPRYRSQNLSYWAKAGQMLGAADFSLSGNSGGDSYNMGGVTFAPQITVTGMADKQSIMEAIRDEYPEFLDMLEEWWNGRGKPVYG